ncbi:conserved hypothetical protein [Hyphomicrobiales bacterium]|nr:conserved hypothetical protein [Hyphomicrobiales bacterium]CAH1702429.1 conserved hypothetical protein [Hyphomicrobiales bacterium]CAI0346629.1 conserved hypothetical protein [Hyphomicrobiales bacterium]
MSRETIYIVVNGTPSEEEDALIPGIYSAEVDADLSPEEKAEVALDHFHENNGIACLDDFDIGAYLASGEELPRMEAYQPNSLSARGEYGEFVGDDAPAEVLKLRTSNDPAPSI